jgi:hypothetical protein
VPKGYTTSSCPLKGRVFGHVAKGKQATALLDIPSERLVQAALRTVPAWPDRRLLSPISSSQPLEWCTATVDQFMAHYQRLRMPLVALIPGVLVAEAGKSSTTFDPFSVIPIFAGRRLREGHLHWLVAPWVALGMLVIVITAAEGTLGSLPDMHWVSDVGSVFSRSAPYSAPRFPLFRDLPDLMLFLLIVLGFVMLHRQWRNIAGCVPRLLEEGTLRRSSTPKRNAITTALRLNAVIGDPGDQESFERIQRHFSRTGWRVKVAMLIVVLGGGLGLAVLLRLALDQYGFQTWIPSSLTGAARQDWLAEARRSWWASSAHLPGYLLFGLFAWLGMSIIVAYNLMGIVTVAFAVAVYQVIEPSAEWFNKDGVYGWQPVAEVYQSVYKTVALFCAIISILVALLGSKTPLAVIAFAALILLPIPVYVYVPLQVFLSLEKKAKELRLRELTDMLRHVDHADLASRQAFIAEFAYLRDARIRPMSLSRLQISGFTSAILIPIGLTLLQIYLPLGLGRPG